MSKSTIALRWMQSIKGKTEQEQRDKVERNISKLKEIKKVITIKISDIVNRYITVGTNKNPGNQETVNSNETANSKTNNKCNSNDKNINNYVINGIANKAHDDLILVRHKYVHAVSNSNSNIAKSKGCINSKQLKVIHSKVKLKVTDGDIDIIRDQQ